MTMHTDEGGATVTREQKQPLVVILGPTGVGKTALAVEVCAQLEGEIVSADSRQFYRHMHIGTAKPTPYEQARARHHLIDIADPDETVGLAEFLQLARAAIQDIAARGKLPLVVGGTGQYIRALLEGWRVPRVAPDPELRQALEQLAQTDPDELWRRLLELDPEAADFIDPRNFRRVIRALEVTIKSEVPFSRQRRRSPPPYDALLLGLTLPREALYARVDRRVDTMIEAGLAEEVRALRAMGYGWHLPAMSGLGYVQFRSFFEGTASLEEVSARIKLDTHAFIRRQYTWFRPDAPDIHWLPAHPSPVEPALRLIRSHLALSKGAAPPLEAREA